MSHADDLRQELNAGPRQVPSGPQAGGPQREYSFPSFTVTEYEDHVAGLGDVGVVEVELAISRNTYVFQNDIDNPSQVSPGLAVIDAMQAVGIEKPDGTPDLGVQMGDARGTDTVLVQGVVPPSDVTTADGGFVPFTVVEVPFTLSEFLTIISSFGAAGMARILTDIGEEYTIDNNLGNASLDIGVYDDSTDAISDTDNLSAISTEPSDGNYTRQGQSFSAADLSGDWGADTDNDAVFDMTNTTGTVDSWFAEVNFSSDDTGTTADHLLCTGALSQSYDLSNLSQLTISAGGVGWKVN